MPSKQEYEHPNAQFVLETNTSRLKRFVFLVLAGIFFFIGAAGILLPVLPTTPFLLLTSYLLVRSSPRLNASLLRSRFFGSILRDWQIHGSVRNDIKFKATFVVVIAVGTTMFLFNFSPFPTISTLLLGLVGVAVILSLPKAERPLTD